MTITQRPFGLTRDGHAATAYRLETGHGVTLTVLDYGVTIQSLCIPTNSGLTDVVLGYDSLQEYEDHTYFLGATIGRVANRIGGAAFTLDGVPYPLAKNDGDNHLHGGILGFDRRMWQGEIVENGVRFSRVSPDGEEGYPGNLHVQVTVTLSEDNTLRLIYDADCDRDTIVNLTNHSYFNLAGGGSVLEHTLQVFANQITESDEHSIPTGRLLDVMGTPFDFRLPKTIGRDIQDDDQQLRFGDGYDHNFVLTGRDAALLRCDASGLSMRVRTTMPGMQLYTGNFLQRHPGKDGRIIDRRGAVCLETQLFPDALHHYGFPSPILRKGQHLHSETSYAFQHIWKRSSEREYWKIRSER